MLSPHLRLAFLSLLLVALTCSHLTAGPAAEPKLLTAEQKEKLKERDRLSAEAHKFRSEGKLVEAIAAAQKMLAVEREIFGNFHEDVAGSFWLLAEIHEQREDFPAARKAREEVLAIQIKLHGEKHWEVTDARLAVAHVDLLAKLDIGDRRQLAKADQLRAQSLQLNRQGKYQQALDPARQVVAIRKQILGENHRSYASSLNDLAFTHHMQGDYAKAEPLYRQASEINKQVLGESHPSYATNLDNLGGLYSNQGDHTKAESLYRQALEIRKQALGEKHPDYAGSLSNLASLYNSRGDYPRAEPLLRQSLEIRQQSLGPKHPDCVYSLNNLAYCYRAQGLYSKAEPLYRQAVEIRKEVLGEKHPDYAFSLNNLAWIYTVQADYARAEPLYRQALEITKETLGEKHAEYGRCLNNLAELYKLQGDYARAEPLFSQALEVTRGARGEKHPHYVIALNNLALLYSGMGNYAKAEPLYCQAMEISKAVLGEQHPSHAIQVHNLASLYKSMGEYAKAEPLYHQALEISKNALGEHHPSYATSLHNLALLYKSRGDYAKADPLYRQALAIGKKALGEQHPQYAIGLSELALLYVASGRPNQGVPLSVQAVQATLALLDHTAAIQSEQQQIRMMDALRMHLNAYLSVTAAASVTGEQVYAELLPWKGIVTARQHHISLMRRAAQGSQPEVVKLYDDHDAAARKLSTLINMTPSAKDLETHRQKIEDASKEVERLQKALAAASADFRKALEQRRRTTEDIRKALPAKAALVDVLEYTHYTPRTEPKGADKWERRLAAFVVRPGKPVERVDLGPAADISRAVDDWRRSFGIGKEGHDAGMRLRQRVWDKLNPHLDGVQAVVISPDGALTRFPLAALPGIEPGRYLIEELAVAVVAVPQQLPELLAPQSQPGSESASLLLVGEVDYSGDAGTTVIADSRSALRDSGSPFQWPTLAKTGKEIETIRDEFRKAHTSPKVSELRRGQPTEAAVREHANEHCYLHFATHGYFAKPKVRSVLAAKLVDPRRDQVSRQDAINHHPGVLSGLVLAGANRPVELHRDDGVLTALEIAALEMGKVELAVLSACETGLGETAGGEGLLGLQRAFQTAGARTVVASLWEVPDDETQQLMTRFYANLWGKKMGRLEALREAQLYILYGGKAPGYLAERGLTRLDPPRDKTEPSFTRASPYLWAAWVLSGDPGELSRIVIVVHEPGPEHMDGSALVPPASALAWVVPVLGSVLGLMLLVIIWKSRRGAPVS